VFRVSIHQGLYCRSFSLTFTPTVGQWSASDLPYAKDRLLRVTFPNRAPFPCVRIGMSSPTLQFCKMAMFRLLEWRVTVLPPSPSGPSVVWFCLSSIFFFQSCPSLLPAEPLSHRSFCLCVENLPPRFFLSSSRPASLSVFVSGR